MSRQEIENANEELASFGYTPSLARKLSLWDLVAFGLNYLQPIGPAVIFGSLLMTSGGSAILPYLLAFIGMFFTLYSYIIFSKQYPITGSIYSYLYQVIGPRTAFIVGWLLMLDYLLIPTVTLVASSHYLNAMYPQLRYEGLILFLGVLLGLLNIRGVKITARVSMVILLIQLIVVLAFITLAVHWVSTMPHFSIISSSPFKYNNLSNLLSASSIAIFGYLGFDAISTLAEESRFPKRDIPQAMLICLIIGCFLACLIGYFSVLLIPSWRTLFQTNSDWMNATLFHLASMIGGAHFSVLFTATFILSMLATNIVGTTSAARLLFGMGRDKMLPTTLFSKVHEYWKTPYWNIILLSLISIIIGSEATIDQIAELINFGAIASFIMLNLGLIWFHFQTRSKKIMNFIFPILGAFIMLCIFINLSQTTLIFGGIWLAFGIIISVCTCIKSQ